MSAALPGLVLPGNQHSTLPVLEPCSLPLTLPPTLLLRVKSVLTWLAGDGWWRAGADAGLASWAEATLGAA